MALKVLQACCCKLSKNTPVQSAIEVSCITSEFPLLVLVVAQKLVTTAQLYSNELFPSATFIHQCQNLAFTVCPHGNCVSSLVSAASQNELEAHQSGVYLDVFMYFTVIYSNWTRSVAFKLTEGRFRLDT